MQSSSKPTSDTSVSTKSSTSNSETQMTHAKSSMATGESRVGHSLTLADLKSSSPFWTSGNHSQVTLKYTSGIKHLASLSKMSTARLQRCSAYLYMLPVVIFAYRLLQSHPWCQIRLLGSHVWYPNYDCCEAICGTPNTTVAKSSVASQNYLAR